MKSKFEYAEHRRLSGSSTYGTKGKNKMIYECRKCSKSEPCTLHPCFHTDTPGNPWKCPYGGAANWKPRYGVITIDYRDDVDRLRAEVAALGEGIAVQVQKTKAAEARVRELKAEVGRLEGEQSGMDSLIAQANAMNDKLKADVERLENDLAACMALRDLYFGSIETTLKISGAPSMVHVHDLIQEIIGLYKQAMCDVSIKPDLLEAVRGLGFEMADFEETLARVKELADDVNNLEMDIENLEAGIKSQDRVLTDKYNKQLSCAESALQAWENEVNAAATVRADRDRLQAALDKAQEWVPHVGARIAYDELQTENDRHKAEVERLNDVLQCVADKERQAELTNKQYEEACEAVVATAHGNSYGLTDRDVIAVLKMAARECENALGSEKTTALLDRHGVVVKGETDERDG